MSDKTSFYPELARDIAPPAGRLGVLLPGLGAVSTTLIAGIHLIGKGLALLVYDPEVRLSSLLGANRKFIETHVPHIGGLIRDDLDAVVNDSDVLVVGLNDKQTIEALKRLARPDQVLIDVVHIGEHAGMGAGYVGLSWR